MPNGEEWKRYMPRIPTELERRANPGYWAWMEQQAKAAYTRSLGKPAKVKAPPRIPTEEEKATMPAWAIYLEQQARAAQPKPIPYQPMEEWERAYWPGEGVMPVKPTAPTAPEAVDWRTNFESEPPYPEYASPETHKWTWVYEFKSNPVTGDYEDLSHWELVPIEKIDESLDTFAATLPDGSIQFRSRKTGKVVDTIPPPSKAPGVPKVMPVQQTAPDGSVWMVYMEYDPVTGGAVERIRERIVAAPAKPTPMSDYEKAQIDIANRSESRTAALKLLEFAASLEGPRQWAKYAKLIGGVEPTPPEWMAKYTGRAPEYEEIPAEQPGWLPMPSGAGGAQYGQVYGAAPPSPSWQLPAGVTAGPIRLREELGPHKQFEQWWGGGEPTRQLKTPGLPEQTPQAATWGQFTPTQQQQILGWQEYGGESAADYLARISKKWPQYPAPPTTRTPAWR